MVKQLCGRCSECDLEHPVYRYGEAFYPCKRHFKNVGTKDKPKIKYRMRKAHDVCLMIVVPVVKEVVKEVIPPKPKKKKRQPPKKKKAIPPQIEEPNIIYPIKEPIPEPEIKATLVYGDGTEEDFTPPDPIAEIIELTPEEKKAIKRQALEAQIAELEATE